MSIEEPRVAATEAQARNRYLAMTGVRIAGSAGAVFGLVLLGRAPDIVTKLLGITIILSALLVTATVPRSMAERWRSPRD